MQIKQQALQSQIQKYIAPLYLLIGQDNYLIEDSLNSIKSSIKKNHDCDEKLISIQSPDDWNIIPDEANSYSLFSETVLLNIVYDKKTLDATGKKILTEYLKSINPRCHIVIRAPNIPAKQLLWLTNHESVVVVVSYPLTTDAMKGWVANQLRAKSLSFQAQVPELIVQYTQGNMLACAQVVEKIALTNEPNSQIDSQKALEHLSDQCEHSLFELVEACLMGKGDKAIQIVQHASSNKSESTLVLWMLTQEVRTLLQLLFLSQQGIDIKTACNQLKIWPQRVSLYQLAMKRFNTYDLRHLLHYCNTIDEQIKSSLNTQVWNSLETLSLSLCLGKRLEGPCIL